MDNLKKRLKVFLLGDPNQLPGKRQIVTKRDVKANQLEARFVKTHSRAKLPTQAHSEIDIGDSGFDLYAVVDERGSATKFDIVGAAHIIVPARGSVVVPIGLKLAYVSPGYWFRVEARSGLGFKYGIQPHFGIIDNPYRGDLAIKLYNLTDVDYKVVDGDRIAQIIFYPLVQPKLSFTEVVDETTRGDGGFGKSGR